VHVLIKVLKASDGLPRLRLLSRSTGSFLAMHMHLLPATWPITGNMVFLCCLIIPRSALLYISELVFLFLRKSYSCMPAGAMPGICLGVWVKPSQDSSIHVTSHLLFQLQLHEARRLGQWQLAAVILLWQVASRPACSRFASNVAGNWLAVNVCRSRSLATRLVDAGSNLPAMFWQFIAVIRLVSWAMHSQSS
jgi:hypothetical protein